MLTGSVSRQAGGVFGALAGLSTALHTEGIVVSVVGLRDAHTDADSDAWGPVPVTAGRVTGPRAFGYSSEFGRILARIQPDIVHVHGLWMHASLAAHMWAGQRGARSVVSPHGMLDEWALRNAAWKKRVAQALYQGPHLRRAACLHALGESEHRAIRALGLLNPVCIIPNGVPLVCGTAGVPAWRARLPINARVLLYLGRLHPKKGLSGLLRAWASAVAAPGTTHPWHLVIAGWDDGSHRQELEAQAKQSGLARTVHFIGPQFGYEKTSSFASADAFVLPSLSEGLPVAALEAWSHSLPVLMTEQCNLPEGFAAGAALRIGPNWLEMVPALRRLMLMGEDERRAIGGAGRHLVADRFTWPALAAQMASVYGWLLGRCPLPDWVRMPSPAMRAAASAAAKAG